MKAWRLIAPEIRFCSWTVVHRAALSAAVLHVSSHCLSLFATSCATEGNPVLPSARSVAKGCGYENVLVSWQKSWRWSEKDHTVIDTVRNILQHFASEAGLKWLELHTEGKMSSFLIRHLILGRVWYTASVHLVTLNEVKLQWLWNRFLNLCWQIQEIATSCCCPKWLNGSERPDNIRCFWTWSCRCKLKMCSNRQVKQREHWEWLTELHRGWLSTENHAQP